MKTRVDLRTNSNKYIILVASICICACMRSLLILIRYPVFDGHSPKTKKKPEQKRLKKRSGNISQEERAIENSLQYRSLNAKLLRPRRNAHMKNYVCNVWNKWVLIENEILYCHRRAEVAAASTDANMACIRLRSATRMVLKNCKCSVVHSGLVWVPYTRIKY